MSEAKTSESRTDKSLRLTLETTFSFSELVASKSVFAHSDMLDFIPVSGIWAIIRDYCVCLLPKTVVVDIGASTTRAGFQDFDDSKPPQVVFPTVIGSMLKDMFGPDEYVGAKAIEQSRHCRIHYPFHGHHLDGFSLNSYTKKIWRHTFDELQIPKDASCDLLVVESAFAERKYRATLCETQFGEFGVNSLAMVPSAVLSLIASGRTEGVTVEVGENTTDIVPVYEGHCLRWASRQMRSGGSDVIRNAGRAPWKGPAVLNAAERIAFADAMKKHFWVVSNSGDEIAKAKSSEHISYQLPDGRVLWFGPERFEAANVLFQPDHESETPSAGMASLLKEALFAAGQVLETSTLYSEIVLAGAVTMIPGFAERLKSDLLIVSPKDFAHRTRIIANPNRKHAAFIGGAIWASLSTSRQSYVSRLEYEEFGPDYVNVKCF